MVEVKILVDNENVTLPSYNTPYASGMDIKAYLPEDSRIEIFHCYIEKVKDQNENLKKRIHIFPGGRALIPSGIKVSIPKGYEIQIRPRSGLALKHGITVLNTPGTIDSDYRGNIGVILFNSSDTTFVVNDGDRIAQLILAKVEVCKWNKVDTLDETERAKGGFGSTGVK